MSMTRLVSLLWVSFVVAAMIIDVFAAETHPSADPDLILQKLNVPEGFEIDYYHNKVPSARSMALGRTGIVYVGTNEIFHDADDPCYDCFSGDTVYALVDADNDYKAEEIVTVAADLNNPNGVAYHQGDLYVAEISRILKFVNIDFTFRDSPDFVVVTDAFPTDLHHGWKYIGFSPPPESMLYVPVGAPCNVCERESPFSGIMRLDVTQKNPVPERFASGIRNSVGFDWHPVTGQMWFTDNGRDNWGNDRPPDELNVAPRAGLDFGFPYCYGYALVDPEFNKEGKCDAPYTGAALELGPHVAAIGMKFYAGYRPTAQTPFPRQFHNQVFIAEHGSWNRDKRIGYRVTLAAVSKPVNTEGVVNVGGDDLWEDKYVVFADGFLSDKGEVYGRPTDVLIMDDGSLLVSSDINGAVFRIKYTGKGVEKDENGQPIWAWKSAYPVTMVVNSGLVAGVAIFALIVMATGIGSMMWVLRVRTPAAGTLSTLGNRNVA